MITSTALLLQYYCGVAVVLYYKIIVSSSHIKITQQLQTEMCIKSLSYHEIMITQAITNYARKYYDSTLNKS